MPLALILIVLSAAWRMARVKVLARRPAVAEVGAGVVPVTCGYVNLNADKAWLAREKRALPASLDELTRPEWAGQLVVPNPATSSPGLAFLLATVGGLGEAAAFDWWARMRANGLKVVKGWSEAYYTEFSRNGGGRPLVVSYASSPPAEVLFADGQVQAGGRTLAFASEMKALASLHTRPRSVGQIHPPPLANHGGCAPPSPGLASAGRKPAARRWNRRRR